ncbi:DUF4259 domain-containing protein [Variovorax sp. Root411]|uniref:DUF4259 domain-containing protein n=1 Tax=Variovorax sp. Root411 TaxID=1736530 RepID=UPI0009E7C7A8
MRIQKYACVAAFALTISFSAGAGAWGEGPFDNDDAQDWLTECARSAGAPAIAAAIDAALRPGYLEADAGSVAVAAAEVIASVDGNRSAATSAESAPCLEKTHMPQVRALAPRARKALARVSDLSHSELAQQWAAGKSNRWATGISQLATRLERQ